MCPLFLLKQKSTEVKNMRYHNITKDDMLNGDGLRTVLWVAGCDHGCKGCQNPVTWDPNSGLEFDEAAKEEIFEQLNQSYIAGVTFSGGDPLYWGNVAGITFSGGDPLYRGNRLEVTAFAKELKEKYPKKTIWLYTGSLWESIVEMDILQYVDVLVDGEFIEEKKDVSLKWKGSSNQRVIDVQQSLKTGTVVLHT